MSTDTFVTAVEVKRPAGVRKFGTLRHENGYVAFEGVDGRQRIRVPAEQVTNVAPHRGGHGFWVSFQDRRYFVSPRSRARPGGFNPFFALVRPFLTFRYLLWKLRGRRRNRELTREWVQRLANGSARPARGLHGIIRIPLRVVPMSFVVLAVPVLQALMSAG